MWICAYRDWAKKIYYETSSIIQSTLISSRVDLKNSVSMFGPNDKIFFIGWSWKVPNKLIQSHDCICLHPSVLPKYRGGSPVQHQIINGETESAVTFFKMNEQMDAGPILFQKKFSLRGNLEEIFDRISINGRIGLMNIVMGNYTQVHQNEQDSTFYKRRKPEESEISVFDFSKSKAQELYNKIRALQDPYPNAFVVCADGKKLFLKVADYEK